MKKARSPLFTLFLVVFIDLVGFGIVIPILPYYASSFGASATELGWLMTIYSLCQLVCAPLWGSLSDRIGRRPVLLMTMAGSCVSLLGLAFAGSLPALFVFRAFAGICAANISTANAYIADVTAPEDRAKGMGMIGAAFGLGFIFGPAIGGILSRWGYSAPLFFAAGLSALNITAALRYLVEPPISAALRAMNRPKRWSRESLQLVFGNPLSRTATGLFFLSTLAITQMEVVFALYMKDRFALGAQSAGGLLAFMGILLAAIQGGAIGKLSKRFGERQLISLGFPVMALGMLVFGLAGTIPAVMIGLALLALGNGVTGPSLSSLASQGAPPQAKGAVLGTYQSAGSLARILGPPIAGYLYDRLGHSHPYFASAGVLCLGFWVCALWQLGSLSPIAELRRDFRALGFKGLVKKHGWKLFAMFFCFYLVRDISLYIVTPWLIARGFFTR